MRVVWFRGGYYAYWRDGSQPKRTALRTKDRETADRRLRDLELSLRRKATTASEIMDAYIEDRGQRPGIERARHAWKRLAPVFGHLRPDQIDRPLCRAYVHQRRRAKAKDGTIIKELSSLRAALRWQDRATPAIIERELSG